MTSVGLEKKRDYYLDNVKTVLIFLVVLGHFLLPMKSNFYAQRLVQFIYLFHMPCFIFVSGYFSKKMRTDLKMNTRKIISALWWYVVLRIGMKCSGLLTGAAGSLMIDFTDCSGASWYFFSLATWYFMLPFIAKKRKIPTFVISVIVGLLVGYVSYIGKIFSLSRTLVYWPFFLAGSFLEESNLKILKSRILRILSLVLIPVIMILTMKYGIVITQVKRLMYGANGYEILKQDYLYGAFYRLLYYFIASIMLILLFSVIPRNKTKITYIGKYTLEVYICHTLIRYTIESLGYYTMNWLTDWRGVLAAFIESVFLVWLFGNQYVHKLFSLISYERLKEHVHKTGKRGLFRYPE